MPSSSTSAFANVPLRSLKASLRQGESDSRAVQKTNPEEKTLSKDAGEVLDLARSNARLEAKQMADDMGISHSLVLRGLKSEDGLSFHKLWELDDAFWAELLIAIARKRNVAIVRTTIEVPAMRRRA
jgi:ribosome-binding protein aMBF1 (putative translation factor)